MYETHQVKFISAYTANLIAHLTYPARSQAINTFEDILKAPEEVTVHTRQYASQHMILQESSNQVLKACH